MLTAFFPPMNGFRANSYISSFAYLALYSINHMLFDVSFVYFFIMGLNFSFFISKVQAYFFILKVKEQVFSQI